MYISTEFYFNFTINTTLLYREDKVCNNVTMHEAQTRSIGSSKKKPVIKRLKTIQKLIPLESVVSN